MTNAQKWIAIFLGFFIVLFVITYLTEPNEDNPDYTMETEQLSGKEIYADLNCANCHGENLEGSDLAPALSGLSSYWSKTKLISYLRNPSDFRNTERIKNLHKQFSETIMPQFDGTDVKKLGILADYLLQK